MNNEESKNKAKELIGEYRNENSQKNLDALINQLLRTPVEVPGMLPATVDKEALMEKAKEGAFKMPADVRPAPCFLRNEEGVLYLPVYTHKTEVPKEPKFDVLMGLPFVACLAFATAGKTPPEGIVLNPFSDNLIIKRPLVERIKKQTDEQAARINEIKKNGGKKIKVSRDQFEVMMVQRSEFHDIPKQLYDGGMEYMDKLCDERESLIFETVRTAFQDVKLCPYSENDFSVMPLNISPTLLLVRVDMPTPKLKGQWCHRIYLTINPESGEMHYYTIENGKEKKSHILGEITKDLVRVEHGEAPVEGAELQFIMDLAEGKFNEVTS
ncbi:MAG: SseB family protein [Lachnospiraceae bacterium]|nr:SseB family protein [Lachnospiraceae bacterium]